MYQSDLMHSIHCIMLEKDLKVSILNKYYRKLKCERNNRLIILGEKSKACFTVSIRVRCWKNWYHKRGNPWKGKREN